MPGFDISRMFGGQEIPFEWLPYALASKDVERSVDAFFGELIDGGHRSPVDHLSHMGAIDPLPGPPRHGSDVPAADGINVVVHERHQVGGGSRRCHAEKI